MTTEKQQALEVLETIKALKQQSISALHNGFEKAMQSAQETASEAELNYLKKFNQRQTESLEIGFDLSAKAIKEKFDV